MAFGRSKAAASQEQMDEWTRRFAQALHDELARCPSVEHKYMVLLTLSGMLGQYTCRTAQEAHDALEFVKAAGQMGVSQQLSPGQFG
jgi:uncharacterized protein YbgA (DUF1722 family)